jgi:hypothetical protein
MRPRNQAALLAAEKIGRHLSQIYWQHYQENRFEKNLRVLRLASRAAA